MKRKPVITVLLITLLPYGGCLRCLASDFAGIYPGTRGAALGYSGVIAMEPSSLELNPAGLCFLDGSGAGFSHISLFEGITLGNAVIHMPAGTTSLGFSVLSMDIPEFQGYDEWGFQTKKLKSSGNVFSAGIAFPNRKKTASGKRISFGLGGKYITERLDLRETASAAVSAGVLLRTLLIENEFLLGVSATNLFNDATLPAEGNLGVSYEPSVFGRRLFLAFKYSAPLNNGYTAAAAGIGAEYPVMNNVTLRCGINAKLRNEPVYETTWGIGLKLSGLLFEYAGVNTAEPGPVYRAAIKIPFGRSEDDIWADESFERGMELFGENRFAEAILEFNNVVEKDPLNKEALEMLKKSFEQIK